MDIQNINIFYFHQFSHANICLQTIQKNLVLHLQLQEHTPEACMRYIEEKAAARYLA